MKRYVAKKYAGKMLQVDLKAAGVPYVDAKGLFADFHALRHTYITNLARSGVSLVAAQKLARHSTPMLTAQRYTHIDLQDQKVAVDRLPSLQRPLQRVDDFSGHEVSSGGTEQASATNEGSLDNPAENTEKSRLRQRRGRDLNPRNPCGFTGFRDRHDRPLCHLSGFASCPRRDSGESCHVRDRDLTRHIREAVVSRWQMKQAGCL